MRYYPLDKIFDVNTDYRMEADKFYVIKRIGTDDGGKVTAYVGGQPACEFTSVFAPLHKTSNNVLGPFNLAELYIVVPPNKTLRFEGTSGSKVRAIGLVGELEPGEAMPADLMARYGNMKSARWTYLDDVVTLGVDEAVAAGQEIEIKTYVPASIEKYVLCSYLMVKVSGGTFSEGDFALRLYLDGKPLDILMDYMGRKGIDVLSLPRPPTIDVEMEAFTLRDMPIEVAGDHRLKVTIVNTSGAAKSPDTGSAWSFQFTAPVKYYVTG